MGGCGVDGGGGVVDGVILDARDEDGINVDEALVDVSEKLVGVGGKEDDDVNVVPPCKLNLMNRTRFARSVVGTRNVPGLKESKEGAGDS